MDKNHNVSRTEVGVIARGTAIAVGLGLVLPYCMSGDMPPVEPVAAHQLLIDVPLTPVLLVDPRKPTTPTETAPYPPAPLRAPVDEFWSLSSDDVALFTKSLKIEEEAKRKQVEADREAKRLAVNLPNFMHKGPEDRPFVSITYDDFFSPKDHEQLNTLLNISAEKGVHLTLFPTGGGLQVGINTGQQEVWRRAIREGHEIGNHTFDHVALTGLSDEQVRSQLQRTQDKLDELLGFHYPMRFMRAPGGAGGNADGTRVVKIANEMGYSVVHWDVESANTVGNFDYAIAILDRDAQFAYTQQDPSRKKNLDRKGGSILLFHLSTFNPDAMRYLIEGLTDEFHLKPVSISEFYE